MCSGHEKSRRRYDSFFVGSRSLNEKLRSKADRSCPAFCIRTLLDRLEVLHRIEGDILEIVSDQSVLMLVHLTLVALARPVTYFRFLRLMLRPRAILSVCRRAMKFKARNRHAQKHCKTSTKRWTNRRKTCSSRTWFDPFLVNTDGMTVNDIESD